MSARSDPTSADVLVIGAGGAGMAAAIEAARAGARVIIFDSRPTWGGASFVSGGGCCIAGSPLQEQLGIEDSPEKALEDWIAFGGPEVDLEWARRYLEDSVPGLYAWLADIGVEWTGVQYNEGNRVNRWHAPRNGGEGLTSTIFRAASSYPSIEWRFAAPATDLVVEAGRVVGLVAQGPEGAATEYRGEAVLVASGGFNSNPEMVRQYTPPVGNGVHILCGGGPGAQGGGHKMLERVGARFVNLDVVWMYPYATPDYEDPSGANGVVVRGFKGDVWLNAAGHRFHNEDLRGGATGTPALLAQQPPKCWTIVDGPMAGKIVVSDGRYRRDHAPWREKIQALLDNSPFVARANTLEELADAAGLPRGAVRETIATHNQTLRSGLARDPDFGRRLTGLSPIAEPPFYAIQFWPLARKNFGGVRTDLDCQVLDRNGQVIPGLFAAGEVAGMAGGHINGRAGLEGTMVGPSIYSGRVAGKAIVGAAVTA